MRDVFRSFLTSKMTEMVFNNMLRLVECLYVFNLMTNIKTGICLSRTWCFRLSVVIVKFLGQVLHVDSEEEGYWSSFTSRDHSNDFESIHVETNSSQCTIFYHSSFYILKNNVITELCECEIM